jgi:hypothetical protein
MATNKQGACCLCVVEARGLGRKEKAEHPRGGTHLPIVVWHDSLTVWFRSISFICIA